MAFGTDLGVCPYGTSPKQFPFMVKYGMTPMQAIQAVTSNAADLLGHSDMIGSIKPRKSADMVAVSGDPLKDIKLLGNVEFVMKEGIQAGGNRCLPAVKSNSVTKSSGQLGVALGIAAARWFGSVRAKIVRAQSVNEGFALTGYRRADRELGERHCQCPLDWHWNEGGVEELIRVNGAADNRRSTMWELPR